MNAGILLATVGVTGMVIALGRVAAHDEDGRRPLPSPTDRVADDGVTLDDLQLSGPGDVTGVPDVIVGELQEYVNYAAADGYDAYSFGTTSCNLGGANLTWTAGNNQHPVIGQNMYRVRDGRFEHIGQSWLKHGFCALQQTACGACQPAGSGCPQLLGVGCSDPYSAMRNGGQSSAGPKYQVNATTGFFPYPPADPGWSGTTARRLRVALDDVVAAQSGVNGSAEYLVEGQYVHWQDNPSTGTSSNNASYRRISLSDQGNVTGFSGPTVREQPAITAWPLFVPEASVNAHVIDSQGTMWIGAAAIDNGDGTWDYVYAVYNQDVDRSGGSIEIPTGTGVTITDVGQRHPEWHSGEPYDNNAWDVTIGKDAISFATAQPYAGNPNGNAIRWGTTATFWFTADAPPQDIDATIGIFKPGTPTSFAATVAAPAGLGCPSDLDDDGTTGFDDLVLLLGNWGDCPGCGADLDDDDAVGFNDLAMLLGAWGPC